MTETRSGGCLCGAVRFDANVPRPEFSMCHCTMCRRWTAGPFMTVHCPGKATFIKAEALTWYRGSPWAERGFCAVCGTSLFWRLVENPDRMLMVNVDAFDRNDDLHLNQHIYVDAQPGRYAFADDRPRLTEAALLAELGLTPPGSG